MPRKLPQEVLDLISVYQTSQKRLTEILARQLDLNNSTFYTNRMLTQIDAELKALNEYAAVWTDKNIPAAYEKGAQTAYATFRTLAIPFDERAGNANIVQLLTRNSYGMLEDAAHSVGRMIKDEVRKAGVETIAEKLATGSTVKQTKARLLERFQQNGITALTDKRGREIRLDSYSELVARSTTREATNTGTLETAKGEGFDLVKMSSHSSSCPVCAPLEGRVYSITGNTPGYPKLDRAYSGEYANIHPNCGHTLSIYVPELDKNAEEQKQFSNRPFEVDERAKKQIDSYNAQQAVQTARRNDRNQYEQYKLANVEHLPKSFSGFRASKKSGSDNWQAMRTDYLETQRQIREKAKQPTAP